MSRVTSMGLMMAAGLGLLGLSVVEARRVNGFADPTAAPAPAAPEARGAIAAEGRVAAYPGAEVRLSAERGGRLTAVRFEERERVRRGQLLVQVDDDELQAALAETRAAIAEAAAEIRLAEATLERRRRLVEEKVATPQDLDGAVRDLDVARARLHTAQASEARLEAQIRKTRVVAPFDGTITAREVDPGETVDTGDPVATIADLGRLRIDAEADEADAGALRAGAAVRITADGYPGESWSGRVEEVADTVTLRRLKPQDPARPTDTRIIALKVAFDGAAPLRLGTTVDLSIEPAP